MRKSKITPLALALASPSDTKDPDSKDYALQIDALLRINWVSLSKDKDGFEKFLSDAKQHEIWRRLDPPFASYEDYIRDRTGYTTDVVISVYDERRQTRLTQQLAEAAQPLEISGKHSSRANQHGTDRGSTHAPYLAARLARDRPDILERMKAGEYRSVRAAAIDAGIVKDEKRLSISYDPKRAAQTIRRAFTANQIRQLIDELGNE